MNLQETRDFYVHCLLKSSLPASKSIFPFGAVPKQAFFSSGSTIPRIQRNERIISPCTEKNYVNEIYSACIKNCDQL